MSFNNVYGYCRVSTAGQDLENQKLGIYELIEQEKLQITDWCEETISGKTSYKERKLFEFVKKLKADDLLIVSELSRLGRNSSEIIGLIGELLDKGVCVYSVKDKYRFKNDMQSKIISTLMILFSEIERDLNSQRVKESIAKRKIEGKPIGRPKGSISSKLAPHEDDIKSLLQKGVSKSAIARIYEVCWITVDRFCEQRALA